MAEENFLFLPVGEICQRDVVVCLPDEQLVAASETMRVKNISSLVVCENGSPVGILTDRDLRNKVVAKGLEPQGISVREVMNTPLVTVEEDDFLFEALHQMSRHAIHRVCVTDSAGRLTGIITDSDILRLQTRSPQQLIREIEESGSVADLGELHARIEGLVLHLTGSGVAIRDLVRMIAHLNDRILVRLIALVRGAHFPELTERYAFIVLGSEGRQEQTLTTDQDNAIVHADDLASHEIDQLADFSRELIDGLIAIGVPPCPGGIMARNETWRRSLSGWETILDNWLSAPTPENILNVSMFCDLRFISGDQDLERRLKEMVTTRLRGESYYLAHMGANILRFPPPLGIFGAIKTEKSGEHRGKIDLKKGGIFAITEGVKLLALEAGCLNGGTIERLKSLAGTEVLTGLEAQNLEESFNYLVLLRLRGQAEALRRGEATSNHLALDSLNRMEQGRLRLALEEVRSFQGLLRRRFNLEMFG